MRYAFALAVGWFVTVAVCLAWGVCLYWPLSEFDVEHVLKTATWPGLFSLVFGGMNQALGREAKFSDSLIISLIVTICTAGVMWLVAVAEAMGHC